MAVINTRRLLKPALRNIFRDIQDYFCYRNSRSLRNLASTFLNDDTPFSRHEHPLNISQSRLPILLLPCRSFSATSTVAPTSLVSKSLSPNCETGFVEVKLGDGIKGTESAPEGQYVLAFTCNCCNHRTARKFSKKSYNEGIVLIKCPKCLNIHLIADNLGWFSDSSINIETIMANKGEAVIRNLRG